MAEEVKRIRVTGIGDSVMAGFLDSDRQDHGGWLACLPKDRFETRNLAVSGSTAEQWCNDWNGNLSRALKLAPETDAYCVSLLGNDLFAAMMPESTGGSVITQAEFERAIQNFIRVLMKLCEADKRVFVLEYGNPWPDDWMRTAAVEKLNIEVRKAVHFVCKTEYVGLSIILFNDLLSKEGMMGSGVHPTEAGYGAMAKRMEEMLNEIICLKLTEIP